MGSYRLPSIHRSVDRSIEPRPIPPTNIPNTTHRRLGNGAYGVVVAAKDTGSGKAVAIKKCFNIFQSLSDAKKIAREVHIYGRGFGIFLGGSFGGCVY